MPDYSLGKIYEIVCNQTGERYVGSTTCKYLCIRMANHRLGAKKGAGTTSKQIIDRGDYICNLLEAFPCETKDQLIKREREWCEKAPCINKNKPYLDNAEYAEIHRKYSKAYYASHKEEKKQKMKEYAAGRKEAMKAYYLANKEYFVKKRNEYREKMTDEQKKAKFAREKIRREEYKKNKVDCPCGCAVQKYNLNDHLKSQKHLAYLKGLESNKNNLDNNICQSQEQILKTELESL